MAIYSWTGIASNFPRNQRVYKLRWDTSIVCTDLTAPNGMIAEAPDIDCDGISWRNATAATPYAYAGKNRFSLTQDFITNRVGGYTDQYFTALTVSTLVSGTTYEVILPSTQAYYWGGLSNVSDYTLGTQKVHLAKDVSALSFPQSGSTIEFVFDEVGTWTYTAPAWVSITSGAGYSNELVLTATTTANTTTSRLSGNIVFTDGSNTITLPVSQKTESSGSGGGVYLGGLGVLGCYLGASAIQGCYLGSTYIFPQAQDATIKYNADAQVTPNVAYSDSGWTTPLSSETYDSATSAGTVSFSGTGTTIPDNAYCGSTLTSVSLGKGVVSIGASAFANCSSLLQISIPRTVASIGNSAFAYGGLMGVKVPNSVTALGTELFSHDTLLESAVLPKDITSIPAGTFYGCSSLSAFTTPSGVTSIGSNAFRNTSSLTAITIPSGVTDVALNAFLSSGLEEITFESTTPPTVHNNSFNVTSATGVIKCPAGTKSTYQTWLTTTLSGQSISGWTVTSGPENNEIWYTTANGQVATVTNSNFQVYDSGGTQLSIVSNTYTDTGVITFNGDVYKFGNTSNTQANTSGMTTITFPESLRELGDYAINSSLCDGTKVVKFSGGFLSNVGHEALREVSTIERIEFAGLNCTPGFWSIASLPNVTSITFTDVSQVTSWTPTVYPEYRSLSAVYKLEELRLPGLQVSLDLTRAPSYPQTRGALTAMTETAWATLFNDLATVSDGQVLTIGTNILANLSSQTKAIATNKGWTLQ